MYPLLLESIHLVSHLEGVTIGLGASGTEDAFRINNDPVFVILKHISTKVAHDVTKGHVIVRRQM